MLEDRNRKREDTSLANWSDREQKVTTHIIGFYFSNKMDFLRVSDKREDTALALLLNLSSNSRKQSQNNTVVVQQ
jgi:hypothetical protein